MKIIKTSLKIFLFFTLLTGLVYPLLITGIAQIAFPAKANGSLIIKDNVTIGSKLIGQQFDSDKYFTSRPSYALYNPLPSGGSNYSLTNARLKQLVAERRHNFIIFNQLDSLKTIPSEMLFASSSGLDPHISPEAALLQVDRIVRVRNFSFEQRQELLDYINTNTELPQLLCFGENRINVLTLNMELNSLDRLSTYNK
jgi:potassium-transporting ATPase KdpC subunit